MPSIFYSNMLSTNSNFIDISCGLYYIVIILFIIIEGSCSAEAQACDCKCDTL